MARRRLADRLVAEQGFVEGPFERIQASIDPDRIDEALQATGTATLRRRRLPAEQVIWLVLGMALYRNRPIDEIVAKLDLALPGRRGPTAAPSAVAQARRRLGEEPMRWLFERRSETWAHESARRFAWRGLALYAVDGTTARVPHSPENRKYFGGSLGPRGDSALASGSRQHAFGTAGRDRQEVHLVQPALARIHRSSDGSRNRRLFRSRAVKPHMADPYVDRPRTARPVVPKPPMNGIVDRVWCGPPCSERGTGPHLHRSTVLLKVRLQELRWCCAVSDVRNHQAARHRPRVEAVNEPEKPLRAIVSHRVTVIDDLAFSK